nr:GMC oxidoreductase [Mycolicibacterium hodleri]
MIYNRGHRADYDMLADRGNPSWGWDDMLPVFRTIENRTIENHELGAGPTRGTEGLLKISVDTQLPPICEDFIQAGGKLGWSATEDINGSDDERIGPAARTIKNGQRVSSARAFLHPVTDRSNLTVAVKTTVHRILFRGDKTTGVEASTHHGEIQTLTAGREVILCLGSIATPRLLQLSGIGDRSLLRKLGMDVVVDSPNVGRRMLEHRCFAIQYRLNQNIGYNTSLSTPLAQAVSGVKYLATMTGRLASGAYDVVGFFKTSPELDCPDAQILMAPFSAAPYVPGKDLGLERQPGIQAIAFILRPDSEGSVSITSADPAAPLDIDPNFFATEHDRTKGAKIFRTMRRVFGESPISDYLVEETRPGTEVTTDDAIVDAALDQGHCGYHAVGTGMMGTSDDDVVDSALRVRGVQNLRIMDCSVMPTMISGNLNGPVMAMAWRAADLIMSGG